MESATLYRLVVMLAIIAANALFASAETALVSLRGSRLRQLAAEGATGAQAALNLLARPERFLSVGQVGLTLCSLVLGWAGQDTLERLFAGLVGPTLPPALHAATQVASIVLGFATLTFLHVVLGEVVPKNWAIEHADRLALLLAPVLLVFYRIVEPFVWGIERTAALLSRLIGLRRSLLPGAAGYSPEEIKHVLEASAGSGQILPFERDALGRLLDLRTLAIREIMVPADALSMVEVNASYETTLQVFSETHHSRLPVYVGTRDNVLGIVHVKDLVTYARARARARARLDLLPPFLLRRYVREVPFVPESKLVLAHLDDLRESHTIVSFVVDEYGTLTGMISARDIIEQVFGRIRDEYDPLPLHQSANAPFLVEGTLPLRDLNSEYGIELPAGTEYETVAGFLMFRLRRIPREGDSLDEGNRRYTVTAMEGNRVSEVRIEPLNAGAME